MLKQDEINDDVTDELETTKKVSTEEINAEIKKEETPKDEAKNTDKKDVKEEKEESKASKSLKKKMEKYSNLSDEEFEKMQKKKKSRNIKIGIISGSIILIALIFSIIFALINISNDKIISGISINGIEVSGLTKTEAKGKLDTIIAEKLKKDITLKHEEYETNINAKLIEVKYDVDKALDTAYNTGRDGNIFANNYSILFTMLGKKDINLELNLNEKELTKAIADASSKLPGAMKEASYYIEDDNLIITKGTKGKVIDEEDTKNKIKDIFNNISENNENLINLKIVEKEPKAIDIDAIYKEVHKEPKDAYYTKEPFQIYPEVNGVDFNIDEAKAMLKEDKDEYTIKLEIKVPEVTIDQIGTEAFPDRLSIFTTRYDASNYNRTTNLRLASDKINGKVLMPDDVFSYNQTVGERTIAAGYKDAKIYSGGKVVDGLGGGICQISSTLYNAALLANLEIVDRSNHQFVTSYLPEGRDATVVYGLTDFKFKNTRKYPIKIISSVQNGIATMEIYGIKEEKEYDITFNTTTIATLPFSTQYIEDSSLAPGEEVVEQGGANGIQTETYITRTLNGVVVSTDLLSKDTYTPMQRIVRIGPGVATTNAEPEAPVPTPEPTQTPSQEPAPEQPANPVEEPAPVEPAVENAPTSEEPVQSEGEAEPVE